MPDTYKAAIFRGVGDIDVVDLPYPPCGDGATEELWPEILEMMRSGRYDLASLVTHEFPIDTINEALTVAGNPNLAQKVCISF